MAMASLRDLCEEGKFEKVLQEFKTSKQRQQLDSTDLKKGFKPELSQPLHYAARHGHLKVVRKLIEVYECDAECKNARGATPLHCACYAGHLKVVKYLVNTAKCDPSVKDVDGNCPIAYTCSKPRYLYPPPWPFSSYILSQPAHLKIVYFLMSHRTFDQIDKELHGRLYRLLCYFGTNKDKNLLRQLSIQPEYCTMYLSMAIDHKCWDIAEYLLTNFREAIKQAISKDPGSSPFISACRSGNLEIVKRFINLEICLPDAQSAYSAVLALRHTPKTVELTAYFIETIGCAFAIDSLLSSLMRSKDKDFDLIKLISSHAIDLKDSKGNTPLHIACKYAVVEIVEFLVEKKCNQNALNDHNELPLHIACKHCDATIVKLVSTAPELDVNVKDNAGNTPLHIACERFKCYIWYKRYNETETDFEAIINHLASKKCKLDIQNNDGELPLHIILKSYEHSRSHDKVLCNRLLHIVTDDGSLNINTQDRSRNVALHLACRYDIEAVKYLTSKFKCDVDITDNYGNLPLHSACMYKSKDRRLEMVQIVANDCTQLQLRNRDNYTPLHYACDSLDLDVTNYLVSTKGCKPSQCPDNYDNLSIHCACYDDKDIELLKVLATTENVNQEFFYMNERDDDCGDTDYENDYDRETPLHVACRNNNLPAIKLLKALNCVTSRVDRSDNLPLHHACTQSLACVKLLAPISDEDINACNKDGNTSLHLACKSGVCDVVDYLLSKGALTSVENRNGDLPLHLACSNNSVQLVQLFSDHDLKCTNSNGDTVLHIACRAGAADVVRYLVGECRCSIREKNREGFLPLHFACTKSLEIVKLVLDEDSLLEYIADSSSSIMTPFDMACSAGLLDIVMYLYKIISHQKKDDIEQRALGYACGIYYNKYGEETPDIARAKVIKYLVSECGYDPSSLFMQSYSEQPTSVFDYVCNHNKLELMKALTNLFVDLIDSNGNTPLHYACQRNYYDAVKYLVDQGCDQAVSNHQGDLALHIACEKSLKIVQLLNVSDYGLVNSCNVSGNTPLLVAVKCENFLVVEHLLKNSECDPNIKNRQGENVLHISCKISLDIVKLLVLNKSCDINSQNTDGNTPLQIACILDKSDMIEILLNNPECKANLPNVNGYLPLHIIISQHFCRQHLSSFETSLRYDLKDISLHATELIVKRYPSASLTCDTQGISPLHEVCKYGSIPFLELLTKEIPLDSTDCFGNGSGALHYACSFRQEEVIHWLVTKGFKSHLQNKDGNLPHHLLLSSKRKDCNTSKHNKSNHQFSIKDMIDVLGVSGVSGVKNGEGDTILHLACKNSEAEVLQYLLKYDECKAALSLQNHQGNTPVHIAASKGKRLLSLCTCILKACDVVIQNKDGNTPLHFACKSHNLACAKMLMNLNPSVDVFNKQDELPIHIAAAHSLAMVKLVKCSSQLINSQNLAGDTPLHISSRKPNMDIVRYLIEELKCQTGVPNADNELPFHILCKLTDTKLEDIEKYISVSLINACDKEGNTLLHLSCRSNNSKAVLLLVRMNADTNMQNSTGASPLHYACLHNSLEMVQAVSNCSPVLQASKHTIQSKTILSGDTALHVVCRYGKANFVQFLLSTPHKEALALPNEHGDLPLHIACSSSNIEVVKVIANHKNFDCNAVNTDQDTALHVACKSAKGTTIGQLLVKVMQCKCDVQNKDGNLPLHIACQKKNVSMINTLAAAMEKRHLALRNNKGNTVLHEFLSKHCQKSHIKITKLLVEKMKCKETGDFDPIGIRNCEGELPIHLACRNAHLFIVMCLASQASSASVTNRGNTLLHESCKNRGDDDVMNYIIDNFEDYVSITNKDGDLPLHIACRLKWKWKWKFSQSIVQNVIRLINMTPDVNVTNNAHNSPLHEIYMSGNRNEYHYKSKISILDVFLNKKANFSLQNDCGKTPLHCIYESNNRIDLKTLLKYDSIQIDASIQDKSGDTLIHMMCRNNDFDLLECLLCSKRVTVDLSLSNKQGQTAIMLASDHKIIKCLLEQGAHPEPLYKMYNNFFQKFSCEEPPPTPVMILVVGHPEVGKTSLTISLQNESGSTCTTPLHATGPTAGVVPTDFNSKHYGTVTFYDFAGQPEYYSSHDAVIHITVKNTPPVVLVVVNLQSHVQLIIDQIQFWTNFVSNRYSSLSDKPRMIIIGSHADKVNNPSDIMDKLTSTFKSKLSDPNMILKGYLPINCIQPSSKTLTEIQEYLKKCTEEIRREGVMHFQAHCFYVLLFQIFKDKSTIKLGQVLTAIKHHTSMSAHDENPIVLLPSDRKSVVQLCEELNEMGHIIFIKHPIANLSWLILNKEVLLHDMLGSLFAPSGFTDQFLSCSTGVVPMSQLKERFGSDSNMLIAFLTKMEFCREIHDKAVLSMITNEKLFSNSEKYFFFPNLVGHERPIKTWTTECSGISYRCGWLLQCSREGDLFNAHFIQTLLLRVAFAFALKPPKYDSSAIETYADDDNVMGEENPILDLVLKRMCSLWKNGIHWQERTGVDAIVDVVGQRTLLLLMQCPHGSEVQLIRRRSQIITMVLEAKKELCSKTKLLECFIHPQSVTHPLVQFENCVMFSLPSISDSVAHHQKHVVEHTKSIKIEDLLLFEPYSEITTDIIKQLFNEANSTKPVSDEIIFALADQLQHRYSFFDDACHSSDPFSIKSSHSRPTSERDITRKLTKLLKQVKRSPGGVTFKDLRELLDQFSIYGGRQPSQGISKML